MSRLKQVPRQRAFDMKVGLGFRELADQFGGRHGGILKAELGKTWPSCANFDFSPDKMSDKRYCNRSILVNY
jgi:hypothetical protein